MTVSAKFAGTIPNHQLVLYRRALHPEIFQMKGRRLVRHGASELEAWLMPGSHLLRFQANNFCACELVVDHEGGIPTAGAVAAFPCSGERDYEHSFSDARVSYLTTVATESLTESLYMATLEDMRRLAEENDCICHAWAGECGPCMSMIELDKYPREIHAHCCHLNAAGGIVVRTESIFEVRA